MSASKFAKLLYNGFGIKNVIIKSIDFIEDQGKALIFKVHLKQPLKKCSKCCSKNIHIKDSKKRRLRLVPLGKMTAIPPKNSLAGIAGEWINLGRI